MKLLLKFFEILSSGGRDSQAEYETWPSEELVRVGRTNVWWNANFVGRGLALSHETGVESLSHEMKVEQQKLM